MRTDAGASPRLVLALALAWVIGFAAMAATYAWWVPGLVDRMIVSGVAFPRLTALMVDFEAVIRNAWPIGIPLGAAMILGLPRGQAAPTGKFLVAIEALAAAIVFPGVLLAYNALKA